MPLLRRELAGWSVAAEAPVGNALIAAGATPRRHAHVMSRDLVRDPAPGAWLETRAPDGYQLTPVDRRRPTRSTAVPGRVPALLPDFANVARREGTSKRSSATGS